MNGAAGAGSKGAASSAAAAAPTTLVWLRRDLRLADNPALSTAAQAGPTLPVYLYTPDEEQPWAPGGASRWYLHHSLLTLQSALRQLGADLAVARGGAGAGGDSAALRTAQHGRHGA